MGPPISIDGNDARTSGDHERLDPSMGPPISIDGNDRPEGLSNEGLCAFNGAADKHRRKPEHRKISQDLADPFNGAADKHRPETRDARGGRRHPDASLGPAISIDRNTGVARARSNERLLTGASDKHHGNLVVYDESLEKL